MHLGSSPPDTSNPTVQGVIAYVHDGAWRYVSVPAMYAQLAAETAVELAIHVHTLVDMPTGLAEPSHPIPAASDGQAAQSGLGECQR